jgi:hypothetical protein
MIWPQLWEDWLTVLSNIGPVYNQVLIELTSNGLPHSSFARLPVPLQKVLKAVTRLVNGRVVLAAPHYGLFFRVSCCPCMAGLRQMQLNACGSVQMTACLVLLRPLILMRYSSSSAQAGVPMPAESPQRRWHSCDSFHHGAPVGALLASK